MPSRVVFVTDDHLVVAEPPTQVARTLSSQGFGELTDLHGRTVHVNGATVRYVEEAAHDDAPDR